MYVCLPNPSILVIPLGVTGASILYELGRTGAGQSAAIFEKALAATKKLRSEAATSSMRVTVESDREVHEHKHALEIPKPVVHRHTQQEDQHESRNP